MKLFRKRKAKVGAFAQLAFVIAVFIIFAVLVKPEVGYWVLELVRAIFGN